MTVSFSGSGTSRTINVSTDATFTSFGTVNIPIVVTDAANNSRTITLTKTINDVAPVAGGAFAALSDTTIGDN